MFSDRGREEGFPVVSIWMMAILLTTGCGWQPQLGGISEMPAPSEVSSRNVRFEVHCSECRIAFAAGRRMGESEAEGIWSRSVNVNVGDTREVNLSVITEFGGRITWARIRVDGFLVAEARDLGDRAAGEPIHLSAIIR